MIEVSFTIPEWLAWALVVSFALSAITHTIRIGLHLWERQLRRKAERIDRHRRAT